MFFLQTIEFLTPRSHFGLLILRWVKKPLIPDITAESHHPQSFPVGHSINLTYWCRHCVCDVMIRWRHREYLRQMASRSAITCGSGIAVYWTHVSNSHSNASVPQSRGVQRPANRIESIISCHPWWRHCALDVRALSHQRKYVTLSLTGITSIIWCRFLWRHDSIFWTPSDVILYVKTRDVSFPWR